MPKRSEIRKRKTEHLEICLAEDVESRQKTTWFEHVELIHQALPSLAPKDIDPSINFMGRKLRAPFIIAAMTGGTPAAGKINAQLAQVAAESGVGLALGSQRPMLEDDSAASTFQVRKYAPDALILGNIGISQAVGLKPAQVRSLADRIGADGICLHLNTAMELSQTGGDLPSSRVEQVVAALANLLRDRLVVKETGCGISRETASKLERLGVLNLDVAGAGGTSWVRVENLRKKPAERTIVELEEWGIPTAASIMESAETKLTLVASGGIRSGLDIARSLALGAAMASAALPILCALNKGGRDGASKWIHSAADSLRAVMLLSGCRNIEALRRAPIVITGTLLEWANQRSLRRKTP